VLLPFLLTRGATGGNAPPATAVARRRRGVATLRWQRYKRNY